MNKSLVFFLTLLQTLPLCKITANTDEIVFGQSAFLFSGSLQPYGKSITNGILAKFKSVNDHGGINGKKLRLENMNDYGKTKNHLKNITEMRKNKIDMFIGNMGTGNLLTTIPMVERKEIAIFFPWAGDELTRKPSLTHLINGPGFIEAQIEAIVSHLTEKLRIRKIAIFFAESHFGYKNKNTAVESLEKRGITPVAIASFNRLNVNVHEAARKLMPAEPKAIICLATSMPTAKLTNYFFENGFFGTKFVGIDSTFFAGDILKERGIKIPYASTFPDPKESKLPIVKAFKEDMKKYYPKFPISTLSLSYYVYATIIIEALKKIPGKITKEALIAEIELMKKVNLGGLVADFDLSTRHIFKPTVSILGT